ncbi:hypothetical protein LHYA1_G006319 [Lachnellula hyalina]|uniref:Lysine-specific metallo-endopeptidase domain-containing protein n=1 Tax=Lachnellula hyalina TaxID=1316788 RepID=A0A8H8QZK8_9HELO|nr:uncharacterized protein LHYA1_G006319 [Lachnellula hyalina]TVY25613.1 hypothetical protein LHYA1_G006319 [Lachnellula hyalina]
MKLTSTLVVLFVSFAPSYAYILDPSCGAYKDIVVAGMKGAFDLAQAGADTLNTVETSNDGGGDVLQAQRDLFGFTFADAMTNGKIVPTNAKWATIKNVFDAVLKYNKNNGEPDVTTLRYDYTSLTVDDLIIHCDFTRFDEGYNCRAPAPDRICDMTLGIDWPFGNAYFNCKYMLPYSDKLTQAFVLAPSEVGIPLPSTLQLCPGFLAEINLHESNTLGGQGSTAALAMNWAKYIYDPPSGYPAMDFLSTFDFTLLHELTHAISKGATVDADGSNSYGWNNAYVVAEDDGTRNAENYAFFGLASRMIVPKNGVQAQRPMEDGSIQILAGGSRRSKRDLSHGDNLFGPRAMNSTIARNSSDSISSSNLTSRSNSTTFSTATRGHDSSESISLSSTIAGSALSFISTSSARGHTLSTLSEPASSSSFSSSSEGDKHNSSFTDLSGSVSHTVLPTIATKSPSIFSIHSSSSLTTLLSDRASKNATSITGGLLSESYSSPMSSSKSFYSATEPNRTTTSPSGRSTQASPSRFTSYTSSSTEALLVYHWDKATPTTTTGVSSATHDSHGWPIIPIAHCWFCPPGNGGGGGFGVVIPDVTGPGILPPPTQGVKPPVGFSSNMPPITLDAAGDPTFDTVEPTSQPTDSPSSATSEAKSGSPLRTVSSIPSSTTHASRSCSTQTMSACELSYSMFTPAGASTANISTITVSCSTATACTVSLSSSSTSTAAGVTATPIYDFARRESWYDMQQKMLSEAMANTTDAYITWSSGESSSTRSTRSASKTLLLFGSDNSTSSAAKIVSSSSSKSASKSTTDHSSTESTVPTSKEQSTTSSAINSTDSKSTVQSKPGSSTSSSSHTTILASVHSTTSANVITSCSLSSYTALKTTQSGMTVDVPATIGCACNDDWTAGIGSIVGSDSSTTYTCQITSTYIAVSTGSPKSVTTTAVESVKTTAKPVSTATTIAAPYQTGTCNLHIFEVSKDNTQPLYVQLNITDGGDTLLTSKSYDIKWGGTSNISSTDSKLAEDISIDFTRRTSSSNKLRPRIPAPPVQVPNWQAWIVSIRVGTTTWDSTENDESKPPYCKVGGWNNGDFKDFLEGILSLGANQFEPTRQMDCYWTC